MEQPRAMYLYTIPRCVINLNLISYVPVTGLKFHAHINIGIQVIL
jgi:hypothetical protein